MAKKLDPRLIEALARVFQRSDTSVVPINEIGGMGLEGEDLGGAANGASETLRRTTMFRPADLLHIEFRFVNLDRVDRDGTPILSRRDADEPAFLIAVFGPQHLLEQAFFDPSGSLDAFKTTTPPPLGDQNRADANADEDPSDSYPVKARIARASRIAYHVTDERIVFTAAGLLHAMRVLPLSVVPHAEGAAQIRHWEELATEVGAITTVTGHLAATRATAGQRNPDRSAAALVRLTEAVYLRRTAAEVEARFGAVSAVSAVATDLRTGIKIGPLFTVDLRPPVPRAPESTETALEIPWRLQLSPHSRGAFTHALDEIDHEGRVELWHSRLASRTEAAADLDPSAAPSVDESPSTNRTVRAVWTRDFTPGNGAAQGSDALPKDEDFSKSSTLPPFRASLSARDRMQLVHLTSNHRLTGYKPQPAAVERLMLTAPGGWLALEAHFDPTKVDFLSIEEWRHRATLGRDHYVKVVYQGVLLPFGHRASLVKVTERRVKSDGRATLYQRFFIVVRQPERRFLSSGAKKFDNLMPLRWVRILTAETPPLASPSGLIPNAGGQIFMPTIAITDGVAPPAGHPGAGVQPFHFRFIANDIANRLVEFEGPAVFVEKTVFTGAARDAARNAANGVDTTYPLLGQRLAFAPPLDPDDTTLATESIRFDAEFDTVTSDKSTNFVLPVMRVAHAPVPAMSAFTGQTAAQALTYATAYRAHGVGTGRDPAAHPGNEGGLFLQLADDTGAPIPPSAAVVMGFATQSQKSGGFVTPSVAVTALARRVGPVGGDLAKLASNAGSFDVGGMFGLGGAKLFGILPLADLLPEKKGGPLPAFVAKTVNVVVDLGGAIAEARAFLSSQGVQLAAQDADVEDAVGDLTTAAEAVANSLAAVLQPPHPPQPLGTLLGNLGDHSRALVEALRKLLAAGGAMGLAVPRPDLERVLGLFDRLASLTDEADSVAKAIEDFATGAFLPDRFSARLEWTTELVPWAPSGVSPPVFQPKGDALLRLVSEVQAPLSGGTPTSLVSCSLPPFTISLLGKTPFVAIHVTVMEFSVQPGRKTDVNVELSDGKENRREGIEFLGPLGFVNTLKEIIPFDGFSDPPYLDIEPSGLKAGFDLQIPDLAVGVFALTNIHVGAELSVPFIGESLEFRFFFATRENPFRLQVAFFAGGGFFAITISPKGLKVIEAAFEFGASVEMNFFVASGSLSVMAGIYFRLEVEGETQSVQLTGYFRARGEVDVLGLISASIELYLELSYRSVGEASKAVGKASIKIEVSVGFLSFSVPLSCEKQFAGSSGDPTFLDTMGVFVDYRGAERNPWVEYCEAFGVEAT